MDAALERAIALYQENPIYWAGIILWLFGFATYVPAACGRGRWILDRTGIALCWLGFGLTAFAFLALDDTYRVPPLEWPTFDAAYWRSSSTQIWLLWIAGSVFIAGSWLRVLTPRASWIGLVAAMVGVLASWFSDEDTRRTVLLVGTAIVISALLMTAWRADLFRRRIEPGDYEAELVKLCGGWLRASRLIREQRKRQPHLSRAGAALAVVTRLRHERDPARAL